jgi:hypothetical protein
LKIQIQPNPYFQPSQYYIGESTFDAFFSETDLRSPQRKKDVIVTQHAKWTATRVRSGLLRQSIVDFSKNSRSSDSSSHLQESAKGTVSHRVQRQAKKTPRALRNFAQAKALGAKAQILVVPTLMTAVPFRGRL